MHPPHATIPASRLRQMNDLPTVISKPFASASFTRRAALGVVCVVMTLALGLVGCKSDPAANVPPAATPPVTLQLKQTPITVDVASDERTRLLHLRLKKDLPENTGMLLVFQSDDYFKVPTDNLYLKLDVILLDPMGKVLFVRPMSEALAREFESPVGARYALMVATGVAAKAGIDIGDTVAIPPAVAALSEPVRLPIKLGSETIRMEIAATDALRQRGLMYRTSLPQDAGMVFVFQREQELAFWMKDTRIPLDIVYLERSGRIVSIKHMAPYDINATPSEGFARYAIELNLGAAARLGLKRGDFIDLPEAVRNPKDLE
ncbi:DUF192 domain-containing protein [Humisphaera borealis]|uniref:DUF192 domain-containing protein n=1 Tax=Humisphaera borealis TaxID=2807512 RepID=A0A7M2WSW1_9BACT|nr:DUF192 domain-containing protein [Humisphaera borealis]QOV88509.1 DUF192 domain-containing protein [Humisphaera borealis]